MGDYNRNFSRKDAKHAEKERPASSYTGRDLQRLHPSIPGGLLFLFVGELDAHFLKRDPV